MIQSLSCGSRDSASGRPPASGGEHLLFDLGPWSALGVGAQVEDARSVRPRPRDAGLLHAKVQDPTYGGLDRAAADGALGVAVRAVA